MSETALSDDWPDSGLGRADVAFAAAWVIGWPIVAALLAAWLYR